MKNELIFTHPISKKETKIPAEIILDKDNKKLTFDKKKEQGWTAGGWYIDDEKREFMVKTEEFNPYLDKLLNDLATICIGKEFVAENNLTGLFEIDGNLQPCFAVQKIPGYRDLDSIKDLKDKKSHATKFHPAYAFISLIDFDDSNEENIGLDEFGQVKIIDFNIPRFLSKEQIEYSNTLSKTIPNSPLNTPFYLASLIGHRNAKGMQLIRNRYFGYDGFMNPMERRQWSEASWAEDISYYDVLAGVDAIVRRRQEISDVISASIKKVEEKDISQSQKEEYLKQLQHFATVVDDRISYMDKAFAADLENLKEKENQFKKMKWRLHSKFTDLMKLEKKFFSECIKKSCEEDRKEIAKIIGTTAERKEILEKNVFDENSGENLKKFNDESHVLHNAVMNNDLEMVKWLLDNELADINKTRNIRTHNYQNFRLTPLHIAIANYYDHLVYDLAKSSSNHEMIGYLQKKFFEKNGDKFDQNKNYQGDKFAIMMTFAGLETYRERSSLVNEQAVAKISQAYRAHKSIKAQTHVRLAETPDTRVKI